MEVTDRESFLACFAEESGEVFRHAQNYLPAAIDETGFREFRGPALRVIARFADALTGCDSDAAHWSRICLSLRHCGNFDTQLWIELIQRNPSNVRFAIQAAFWVFACSGANGGKDLADLINRFDSWQLAEEHVPPEARPWWLRSVVPWRKPRQVD